MIPVSLSILVFVLGVLNVQSEILLDEEDGIRLIRPWEQPNNTSSDDSPDNEIGSYGVEGDSPTKCLPPQCEQVKLLLKKRQKLYQCCYKSNTIIPIVTNYYPTDGMGTILTPDYLRLQIEGLRERCPECGIFARKRRSIFKPTFWNTTTISYYSSGLKESAQVEATFADISSKTCLKFNKLATIPATTTPPTLYYIKISSSGGKPNEDVCRAFPGKRSVVDAQPLNLQTVTCFREKNKEVYRLIMLSLGQVSSALGKNRDYYVTYHEDAVREDRRNNFAPFDANTLTVQTVNAPFDYGSLSISKPIGDFSKAMSPAFTTKDALYKNTLGSSIRPTFLDYKLINIQFCADVCKAATISCKNGGYPNPSGTPPSCSTCICPSGYSGTLCDQPQPGTKGPTYTSHDCKPEGGKTSLTADDTVKFIYSPNRDNQAMMYRYYGDAETTCNFVIKAKDPKCFISMKFDPLFDLPCNDGTCIHYVEIKYENDKTKTGPRFCCRGKPDYHNPNGTLVSEGPEAVVLFNSELKVMRDPIGFNLSYTQTCKKQTQPKPPSPPEPPSGNLTESCIEKSPYTPCSGKPASATQTMTQTRNMTCTLKGSKGEPQCFTRVETRSCGRCTVVDKNAKCKIFRFGVCLEYEGTPTTSIEFCNDVSYGSVSYKSKTDSIPMKCPK